MGKAAVDRVLQIKHQNPTNLAESTNLEVKGEGTQTILLFRKGST